MSGAVELGWNLCCRIRRGMFGGVGGAMGRSGRLDRSRPYSVELVRRHESGSGVWLAIGEGVNCVQRRRPGLVTERVDDFPTAVEAFCAGNEEGLAVIYARWSPLVYSIALRSLGDVNDAESVTQRVFIGAWTSRSTLDATRMSLPVWVLEITRNAIAEARVVRPGEAKLPAPQCRADPVSVEGESAGLAEQLLFADGMSRLDALPRQVLHMALHDDLTHDQIAERMGLSPGTVKGHLRRSLFGLRNQLEVQTDAP